MRTISDAGCECVKLRQYDRRPGCLYLQASLNNNRSFIDYHHPFHKDIIIYSPELVVFSRDLPGNCSKPRTLGDYPIKESDFIHDHLLLEYGQFSVTTEQNSSKKLLKPTNRHRLFMCPITKMGESCLFHCETRLQAGVLFVCRHLTTTAPNDPHQTLLQNYIKQQKHFETTEIERGVPLSPIKEEATEALLKLFTNTTIKFTDIDQPDFKSFCCKLIEIGQRSPQNIFRPCFQKWKDTVYQICYVKKLFIR